MEIEFIKVDVNSYSATDLRTNDATKLDFGYKQTNKNKKTTAAVFVKN